MYIYFTVFSTLLCIHYKWNKAKLTAKTFQNFAINEKKRCQLKLSL